MVWRNKDFSYAEAAKVAPILVHYLQGRCLDVGPGTGKVWPRVIGIDRSYDEHGIPATDVIGDADDLSLFSNGAFDSVFSSHCLEDFAPDKTEAVLAEWARVLKIGGYLVLYLPSANLYPKVGEPGANPAHKIDFYPGDVEKLLKKQTVRHGWKLIRSEERDQGDEYSLLIIAQKTICGWKEQLWERNPEGKKRALVIRYGAYGDAIVASSVLPGLKKQGYHVTFNTTPKIKDLLQHNPYIDEWIVQATDYVPNPALGSYWRGISEEYDHVINLCESVEGSLLALPGRLNHAYPQEARRRVMGTVNYLERTHDIAAVPCDDFSGARFYPSKKERGWAEDTAAKMRGKSAGGVPIVVWCVNGSSVHKVYPATHIVVRWLLERTPANVVLYGDPGVGSQLAQQIINKVGNDYADAPRVTNVSNKWPIRDSMTFAEYADVVVGPETGPLNAVAMLPVPKIIYLSHSSPQNLTKHWRNTTVLLPDKADTPCFPCHRMHYEWEHCHRHPESGAALCATSIKPETIFRHIALAIGAQALEAAD